MTADRYININRSLWDERVEQHLASDFYDMPSFLAGRNSLNAIELELLGDVATQSIVHLQCHFGQDSLSLARMGAKVTGVDFSPVAINKAIELNQQLALDAHFICSDILQLDITQLFDKVFASYGVLGWHPQTKSWFEVAARLLKPQGQLILVDFHPMVWMFDDSFEHWQHSYFNHGEIVEHNRSYVDIEPINDDRAQRQKNIGSAEVGWNHSMSDIINAGLSCGLTLVHFSEYDFSPYPCFPNMILSSQGYQSKKYAGRLAMVYALVFKKAF